MRVKTNIWSADLIQSDRNALLKQADRIKEGNTIIQTVKVRATEKSAGNSGQLCILNLRHGIIFAERTLHRSAR